MKEYSSTISLTTNSRGVSCLDTSIGCNSGMSNEHGGCYDDCYAAKSAKLYGFNFSKTILRKFKDKKHTQLILNQINRVKLDFIRIGCSGDPSEDWNHTISILKKIDKCNKQIVVITKHWTKLEQKHLEYFSLINICVNTSVSALDKPHLLESSLQEYNRLKPYCKSILRIVSCDFNIENDRGKELAGIQDKLFNNPDTLDTVLRINKSNKLLTDGVLNAKQTNFLGKRTLASKYNKKTYLGKCSTCIEMCGVDIKPYEQLYPDKRGITKQLKLPFIKAINT